MASNSIYSVSPGVKMMQNWIATLKEKTGRSLDEWVGFINKAGPADEKGRREWLKKVHGVGTNSANFLAERSLGRGDEEDSPEAYLVTAEAYVKDMYSGKRAALKPLYDRLLKFGLAAGKEAKACPCKTMVPLYRNHVFAQIKPATNTRIDMGYALGAMIKAGKKIPARLVDTGGFAKKDRITHRIVIEKPADIDEHVTKWLRRAYDLDE